MNMGNDRNNIADAIEILAEIGMPRGQQNERSALCLLALSNLAPLKYWVGAENHVIGVTPIMEWIKSHYGKDYAPNTRETIRRQTLHQFIESGIVLYNPDNPKRPVNSPKVVYQLESNFLKLIQSFGGPSWQANLATFLAKRETLSKRYAKQRKQNKVPLQIDKELTVSLSPGKHNELIREVIQAFAPRFVPNGRLIYVGDAGDKWGYFDKDLLMELGVRIDPHGKMPDVVLFFPAKRWLLLIEAVTSHGPVGYKRHAELLNLFADSKVGLVFVTAFPSRSFMARHLGEIAWETEVWVADAPSHLIHFNGDKFLGPHNE